VQRQTDSDSQTDTDRKAAAVAVIFNVSTLKAKGEKQEGGVLGAKERTADGNTPEEIAVTCHRYWLNSKRS